MMKSKEQELRYSRQMMYSPIGLDGQELLSQARVAIIGCGALGSASAELLVRAGIGTIHLADRDVVELSNLQRQQLYAEADALEMKPKVIAAAERLRAIRSDVQLLTYMEHVDAELMDMIAAQCDIVVDATDNFETRYIINDAAYKHGIPWVYGACVGSTGCVFSFVPGETACFQCVLPVLPAFNATCDTVGIIAPAVQITASYQCAEVFKWLTGNHTALRRKMLHVDVWNGVHMEIGISRLKDEQCLTCGAHPSYPALSMQAESERYTLLCGRDAVQITPQRDRRVTFEEAVLLAKRLDAVYKVTPYFAEIKMEEVRLILFANGRLLIHGIHDVEIGRKLYHQWFG